MKLVSFLFLLFLSYITYSQFEEIPTPKYFVNLANENGCDTIRVGKYDIQKVQYYRIYETKDEFKIKNRFKLTAYKVGDAILKSYEYIDEKNNAIIADSLSEIFLFPDSSLGIIIYEYHNQFSKGACGLCPTENVKIFRYDTAIECIFDLQIFSGFYPDVKINQTEIIPQKENSVYSNLVIHDTEECFPRAILYWKTIGRFLYINFENTDYTTAHTKDECFKDLIVEFFQYERKYLFKPVPLGK